MEKKSSLRRERLLILFRLNTDINMVLWSVYLEVFEGERQWKKLTLILINRLGEKAQKPHFLDLGLYYTPYVKVKNENS